jgi:hypothetical protein
MSYLNAFGVNDDFGLAAPAPSRDTSPAGHRDLS